MGTMTAANLPYRDPALPVNERVADLLARMTLEEKAAQVSCTFALQSPEALEDPALGLGGVAWLVAAGHHQPREAVQATNAMQTSIAEASRHGIPALLNEEALCGLKVAGATIFPDAIAQAATWDPALIEEMASAIGRHMSAIGVHQALAPVCDVSIDPRWGRTEETYGEDPYLAGCIATGFVRGLQERGQIATLKHFIGYSASEGGRNTDPSHLGPIELREIHGLPFEMAIREGGAHGVMCSYNQIDRMPVQANGDLLTALLRDDYGFDGILITDLNSVNRLDDLHGLSPDPGGSSALAFRAGLDLQMSQPPATDAIIEAVVSGRLAESDIDRAAANVLSWKYRLGVIDDPCVDSVEAPDLDTDEDRALARRVAEASIVLLRNADVDGSPLLPLDDRVRSVAVIGPTADRPLSLLGNYSYPVLDSALVRFNALMDPEIRGEAPEEDDDEEPKQWADDATQLVESVPITTVLAGIRDAAPGLDVRYARGCPIERPERGEIPEAAAVAAECDVAVVVVGDQAGIFNTATIGESIDSATCALPGVQRELVEAVVATGTPTVVVLTHGRAFVLDWMAESVPAIVSAWFPGEEGGSAIASVLFGDTCPGGKLPLSLPGAGGTTPFAYNRTTDRPGLYYDASGDPVFPFGHGLSYTSFEYSDLAVADEIATDETAHVTCTITNTGSRAGDEVVQLYLRDPVARISRPVKELKGFTRVRVEPGESMTVSFALSADRTAIYDPQEGWVVEPGLIEVMIGSSSQDIRLTGEFTLTGPTRQVGADRMLMTPVEIT